MTTVRNELTAVSHTVILSLVPHVQVLVILLPTLGKKKTQGFNFQVVKRFR
jgi:hypothetical protein